MRACVTVSPQLFIMTQIEQHYKAAWEETYKYEYKSIPEQQKHIFKAMQTYAEYYAKKCLKKAADECVVDIVEFDDGVECYPIRSSITNIDLPKHI